MAQFSDLIEHAPVFYRGCDNVLMKFNGIVGDPDIIWKDYVFNYFDIENALYDIFCEEFNSDKDDEDAFSEFVRNNIENFLSDCVAGGYFAEGSHNWRDNY